MPDSNEERPTAFSSWGAATLLSMAAAVLILGGLWGFCGWQRWGGDRDTPRDPTELIVYPAFASIATLIIVPGLILQIRKVRILATRGVMTQGRVENVSIFCKHGVSPTTISYFAGDREYRIRRDLPRNRVREGGFVTVLYDPQNPNRLSISF
jgi:hypothetical protein